MFAYIYMHTMYSLKTLTFNLALSFSKIVFPTQK